MASRDRPNPAVLAGIAVLHLTATSLTWRDLRDRPAALIRGDKTAWRIASAVNTVGSVAYWVYGRRPRGQQGACL